MLSQGPPKSLRRATSRNSFLPRKNSCIIFWSICLYFILFMHYLFFILFAPGLPSDPGFSICHPPLHYLSLDFVISGLEKVLCLWYIFLKKLTLKIDIQPASICCRTLLEIMSWTVFPIYIYFLRPMSYPMFCPFNKHCIDFGLF